MELIQQLSQELKLRPAQVEAAVRLSTRYLTERRLPDKAIDLMDEACSKKVIAKKADAQAGLRRLCAVCKGFAVCPVIF